MITDLFYNKGFTIKISNIDRVDYNLIKEKYEKYGIVLFKNFDINPKKLMSFTNKFTQIYANDASRRDIFFNQSKIKSVDIGNHEIPLHSESSFTNLTPEVIWFYNYDNKFINTPTTICDGIKVWEQLSFKTKKKFLAEPIIFDVNINLPFKRNAKSKEWYLDSIGVSNCKINYKFGKIKYKIQKFAVNHDRKSNKLAFCNHLLSVKDEDQIIDCYFASGKKISKDVWKEINYVTEKLTYNHYWRNKQLFMINNQRFLHGRRQNILDVKRKILNIQTLISNF